MFEKINETSGKNPIINNTTIKNLYETMQSKDYSKSIFLEQFDDDNNGKIDKAEAKNVMKAIDTWFHSDEYVDKQEQRVLDGLNLFIDDWNNYKKTANEMVTREENGTIKKTVYNEKGQEIEFHLLEPRRNGGCMIRNSYYSYYEDNRKFVEKNDDIEYYENGEESSHSTDILKYQENGHLLEYSLQLRSDNPNVVTKNVKFDSDGYVTEYAEENNNDDYGHIKIHYVFSGNDPNNKRVATAIFTKFDENGNIIKEHRFNDIDKSLDKREEYRAFLFGEEAERDKFYEMWENLPLKFAHGFPSSVIFNDQPDIIP